mgnify:CR=1 FL=1
MLSSYLAWLQLKSKRIFFLCCSIVCTCCLIVALLLWHFFVQTAPSGTPHQQNPSIHIAPVFGNGYRTDYWTPTHVTLSNSGSAFKGTLAVHTYTDEGFSGLSTRPSPWSFEDAVTLPHGTYKRMTLYIPYYLGNSTPLGLVATLRNEHNQTVATQIRQLSQDQIKPGEFWIGVLSQNAPSLTQQLNQVSLPGMESLPNNIYALNANTLPDTETALENFDLIIVENFPSATLRPRQISALRSWVNQGGILIENGGPSWQQTLGPFPPELVPVIITGTSSLSPGTTILPIQGSSSQEYEQVSNTAIDPPSTAVPISTAMMYRQEAFSAPEAIITTPQGSPLFVKAHQGAGIICYLGLDLTIAPLNQWIGNTAFWQTVLSQALGDRQLISEMAQNYDSGPGQLLARGGILNQLEPDRSQGPWLVGLVLLCYILVLGLVNLLLARRTKRPSYWRWRLTVCSILVFSLLTYSLAYHQKEASVSENSITTIQFDQGSSLAHITTYTGLFTPSTGDFQLHLPGNSQAQPVANQFLQGNPAALPRDDVPTTITSGASATDLTMHNQRPWTLNPIVSEEDKEFHGNIHASLVLHNNRLVGSITNTLPIALSDLYVLLPHSFVALGNLAAGQIRQIDLPLHSASPSAGKTLADQIAEYHGLPDGYFPYTAKRQPQNDIQSHIAFLSALSGAGSTNAPCGGSCLTRAIMNRGTIYMTGGQVPNSNLKNDYDPLLISGAPATLIGWADQQIVGDNEETVNGVSVPGHHMTFIEKPLNLHFSGQIHVPLDFITAGVANVQSYDAQAILPGIYSMSTGSITFDLPLPDMTRTHINSLTVTVPDLIAHPQGPGTGSAAATSSMAVQFYNWQSGTWDSIKLTQDAYTITNPQVYAGTTGRVLVQVTSKDTNQIYFGKPSLSLNGSALD